MLAVCQCHFLVHALHYRHTDYCWEEQSKVIITELFKEDNNRVLRSTSHFFFFSTIPLNCWESTFLHFLLLHWLCFNLQNLKALESTHTVILTPLTAFIALWSKWSFESYLLYRGSSPVVLPYPTSLNSQCCSGSYAINTRPRAQFGSHADTCRLYSSFRYH